MARRTHLPALALVGLLAAAPAARAEVTADQAKSLETQLQQWLASLVKPAIDVGERPVQVQPEGDHFRLLLPVPPAMIGAGVFDAGAQVTVTARPTDGGRWALEDLRTPWPMRLPMQAGEGAKTKTETIEISADTQEYHGVLDPSFATTSSFDSKLTGVRATSPQALSTTATGTSHSIWQPAGDGRINVLSDVTLDKYEVITLLPDGGRVFSKIDRLGSTSTIKGVAPASLAALIRGVSALIPTMQDKQDQLTPAQREIARGVVFAVRDMIGGAESKQTIDGLSFSGGGHAASLRKMSFGTTMGAPEGKLTLGAEFVLEGIDSPEIPQGVFRDYLPRKLAFKPSIGGIPAEDVVKLALKAIDSDARDMPRLQADAAALLASGPLEISLDELTLDLGLASLTASGGIDISGPNEVSGDAEITLTGLNALIKRANTTRELKDIAPALIFLKGIGRQEGDDTIWELSYENGSFKVNDTDLSALIPGDAPKGGAKPGKKAKP